MLSKEQIENIIKNKYKKYSFDSFDKNYKFIFGKRKIPNDCLYNQKIILHKYNSDKLEFIEMEILKEDNNFEHINKYFTIENNVIELKHCLNIKITQQDIIDWLNIILKINEYGEYSIPIPPSFSQVLVEILDDKTIEIKTSLMFKDKKEREEHLILFANNSNDYWRLYNIIKNLKE